MKKRKKVAVFISNIYEDMAIESQKGLTQAALDNDIKLIYFATFSDSFSRRHYDQYVKYDEGDIVSFRLCDLKDFDGVIKCEASFPEFYTKEIDEIILSSGIPAVRLGDYKPGFYNVLNDETASFGRIVRHLIEEHHCKNIYHLAGKKEYRFTFDRIGAFQKIMSDYGLECGEDKIYFGNLWRDCGEDALEYFLSDCAKHGNKYPDAVVCCNDFEAIGLIDACTSRGIHVPGDMIVTGYDGVEEATHGYPSVTTSRQPFYRVCYEAINTLIRIWNGQQKESVVLQDGDLILNQSCGCKPTDQYYADEIRRLFHERNSRLSYLSQSTTNMILGTSNAGSLEECFTEIEKNARTDTGFKDMLLCLAPGWDQNRLVGPDFPELNEEMTVVAGFRGEESAKHETFSKSDLLPKDMRDDPYPYYIFSVHHLQYYMGYMIVSPDITRAEQIAMKSWLVNVGSILENWRIRTELKKTVNHLENLYNRDMLTGLYNRRGYDMFFHEYYMSCAEKQTELAVFLIDMDNLKYINDNFGHSEGDYSLCAIAEALTKAAQNGEICMRTGGDEFVVLSRDYSEEKASAFITRMRAEMRERILRDKKEYPLDVSCGVYRKIPEIREDLSIEEVRECYLKKADEAMYEEKLVHRKRRTR